MKPISLLIEDFFCHSRSEIDFNEFTSALVVGRAENNDQRSNGIGKSKIFTAITYALFNKTGLKNIENCIRNGAEKCRVTFVFEAMGKTWKVVRGRGRKSNSADLSLFVKNGLIWESMSERTNSQLEEEIAKIIKINYETFKNSVLFAQNDFVSLATLTPEKRKATLRESLMLQDYKKLEDLAKRRVADLIKEQERDKNVLATYAGASEAVKVFETELAGLEPTISGLMESHAVQAEQIARLAETLTVMMQRISAHEIKFKFIETNLLQTRTAVQTLASKKNDLTQKIKLFKMDGEKLIAELASKEASLKEAELKTFRPAKDIIHQIDEITIAISDGNARVKYIDKILTEFNEPLPSGPVCRHCKQVVTDEHRELCEKEAASKKEALAVEKSAHIQSVIDATKIRAELKAELTGVESHNLFIDTLRKAIIHKQSELSKFKTYFDDYKANLAAVKLELEAKTAELLKVEEDWKSLNRTEYDKAQALIANTRTAQMRLRSEMTTLELTLVNAKTNRSVLEDRIISAKKMVNDASALADKLKKTEQDLLIHQQVAQAFSSKGIPTIIIHNMLDDLQVEANNTIAQIKPGIQLKFDIDKENSKGEQTDTLEISYFKDGLEHEWEQLSGGQKLVIMFSLRLALSMTIQKNYGTDLKILLLDEIDASLDKESLELLFEMIKLVEQQFKILLITHNDALKDKFLHAVLVEQDQNLNSTAKIVTSW